MRNFPRSLIEFQHQFSDETACADWLVARRWPNGFICPDCRGSKAWALQAKFATFECAGCGKQTSVTAGTVMHGSKLPLTTWFWAAFLMATHSNGISALQLKSQLGLGSYKTAWLLCAKLRTAMVNPERTPLSGLVEVDETAIACRSKGEPTAAQRNAGMGRSAQGKLLVAGAIEVDDQNRPGRVRLAVINDYTAASLHHFLSTNIAAGSTAKTDGWAGYVGAPSLEHDPHTVGTMAAHIVLPSTHRVFSNLKTWALGVYHGLRRKHLQRYLDEFTFRFNRRRTRHPAFASLLGIATRRNPVTYNMLIAPDTAG